MVFKDQPLVVFRHAPNLRDSLVRVKLPTSQTGIAKGCFKCGKSRCHVCSFISEGSSFCCNVSGKQYSISSRFNCDSSGVVYLLGCKGCGKQYIGGTFTSMRTRSNNYKSSSRQFCHGMSVAQAEICRNFTDANHNRSLEDVTIWIIDRVFGESRLREGF